MADRPPIKSNAFLNALERPVGSLAPLHRAAEN
jgi:hypothetical protein